MHLGRPLAAPQVSCARPISSQTRKIQGDVPALLILRASFACYLREPTDALARTIGALAGQWRSVLQAVGVNYVRKVLTPRT